MSVFFQQPAYSPIHGNPTPPMTPGAVPPGYSSGDIKPNFGDFKPQLPIKKGILIACFIICAYGMDVTKH